MGWTSLPLRISKFANYYDYDYFFLCWGNKFADCMRLRKTSNGLSANVFHSESELQQRNLANMF